MSAALGGGGADEHSGWDELAVGWALHALEPEDETQFSAHLAGCARCVRTVGETSEVMAAMAGDLPQAEPSEGLRDRLRAAVEQTEQIPPAQHRSAEPELPPVTPRAPRPVPEPLPAPVGGSSFGNVRAPLPARSAERRLAWRRGLPIALAAAAVAAVLSLGALNVVATGDRDAAQARAEAESRMLAELLQPGQTTIAPLTDGGRALATVVARDGEVQVVADGLAVNDSHDHTYVVWGLGDDLPKALGTFDVVTSELDLRTVGSTGTGLDDFTEYGISLEPGRQAPSYPTDIVATGEVDS